MHTDVRALIDSGLGGESSAQPQVWAGCLEEVTVEQIFERLVGVCHIERGESNFRMEATDMSKQNGVGHRRNGEESAVWGYLGGNNG